MKTILINLLSDQWIPNYVAIDHFKPDTVISLATAAFKKMVNKFKNAFPDIAHLQYDFHEYDMAKNWTIIKDIIETNRHDNIIFNFTGGTKIMAVSAIMPPLVNRENVKMAYVESKEKLIYIYDTNLDLETVHIASVIPLKTYLAFYNANIKTSQDSLEDYQAERLSIGNSLLNSRSKFFQKQYQYSDVQSDSYSDAQMSIAWTQSSLSIDGNGMGKLKQSGIDNKKNYFMGFWLEELIFDKLETSGLFDSVLMNVEVDQPTSAQSKFPYYEFDVVVTKGISVFVLDCKAGNVKQDHVHKLATATTNYFGTYGKKGFFCKFPQNPVTKEKCKDNRVTIFNIADFNNLPSLILKELER